MKIYRVFIVSLVLDIGFFYILASTNAQVMTNTTGSNTTNSTGGNTSTTHSSQSVIQTGDSQSSSTVINCINTTTIGTAGNPCIVQGAPPTPHNTPVPTVAATPIPVSGGSNNDNGSNGSGGSSPDGGVGSGSSSQSSVNQEVLGASTMAATGNFVYILMEYIFYAGLAFLFLGGVSFAKELRK